MQDYSGHSSEQLARDLFISVEEINADIIAHRPVVNRNPVHIIEEIERRGAVDTKALKKDPVLWQLHSIIRKVPPNDRSKAVEIAKAFKSVSFTQFLAAKREADFTPGLKPGLR